MYNGSSFPPLGGFSMCHWQYVMYFNFKFLNPVAYCSIKSEDSELE